MLSKCANPECSEQFLFLHQRELFHLILSPEVRSAVGDLVESQGERFWLCDQCCKKMTLVWGGTQAKLVPLSTKPVAASPKGYAKVAAKARTYQRAVAAGRDIG